MANKQRPKQHAKGIQIRPVVLRNGLRRAGLLRGKVAHRLFDLPLLPLGQLARLDDEAARAAEALEGDGAVPKMREAHDARVRVDVERVGADLAVDDARLVERLEAVRRELEEGGEVHDVPGLGVARALVLCVPVHGEARIATSFLQRRLNVPDALRRIGGLRGRTPNASFCIGRAGQARISDRGCAGIRTCPCVEVHAGVPKKSLSPGGLLEELCCDHLCHLPDSRRDTIHTIRVSTTCHRSFRLESIGGNTIDLGAENFEPVFVLPCILDDGVEPI